MSLLLQALQKAARSREHTGEQAAAAGPQPVQEPTFDLDAEPALEEEATAEELNLSEDEDLFEPEVAPEPEPPPAALARPATRAAGFGPSASAAHAATILRASEERGTTWLDWVRDRPVHTFAVLAGVFLLFYGAYVYLQVFHPGILRGDFLARPLTAKSPPPPPSPISQGPATQPAPGQPGGQVPAPLNALAAAPTPGTGAAAATPGAAAVGASPAAPQTADPETARPLTGMPQARASAPAVERAQPRQPRVPREAPARREVVTAESSNPLEDTVAVRQPDSPAVTSASLMRAWEALQRGEYEEANALYRMVEQSEPQNVDALLGLAAIAAQRGNTEVATRHYSRALELEPRNPTAQAGLISLLGQSDPQLSESRLKSLIALEPSSANLYFALGNLYARQTQWAQAQQAYFQAYQLQPDNPDYAYNLAVGLEHLSQPKLALSYYRQALELGTVRGHASFDTARVQERVGQLTARIGSQ